MPPSDGLLSDRHLGREQRYPLQLAYCPECTLVQLVRTRPREELFGAEYLYFSSFSEDLLRHSKENAEELVARRRLNRDSLVVEPASNDGYLLKHFAGHGIPVLGIEPAPKQAEAARPTRIPTLPP